MVKLHLFTRYNFLEYTVVCHFTNKYVGKPTLLMSFDRF